MTASLCRVFLIFFGLTVAITRLHAFPGRPLALILPYPATGTQDIEGSPRLTKMVKVVQSLSTPTLTDLLAQGLAAGLGAALDQSVQIERKAGNRGVDGMQYVSNAAPDGHTLLFAGLPVINGREVLLGAAGQLPLPMLEAVAKIAEMPMALVVDEQQGALTLRDLIAQGRARPGRVAIATLGPASSSAIAANAFQDAASMKLLHVEYNGAAAAMNAVATRNVDIAMVPLPAALPHVGGGKLKILAVTSTLRHPSIPSIPTVSESAIAGFSAGGNFDLFVATGTPSKTVSALRVAADSITTDEGWTRLLIARGLLPATR